MYKMRNRSKLFLRSLPAPASDKETGVQVKRLATVSYCDRSKNTDSQFCLCTVNKMGISFFICKNGGCLTSILGFFFF